MEKLLPEVASFLNTFLIFSKHPAFTLGQPRWRRCSTIALMPNHKFTPFNETLSLQGYYEPNIENRRSYPLL